MDYPDSVEYLYALGNEHRAFKLGLQPVARLLAALGNPQHTFRSVHVAGTNGKGSASAMIEAGLRYAGIRTGLFTSPHLVEPTERIRIHGADISHQRFAQAFDSVHAMAEDLVRAGELEAHPSYFETITAMAFCAFREAGIDTAVVEVGLGGRLDATNVITPDLSVIMPVDYDHEAWLGSSIQSIAAEKAGILKQGIPAVFAPQRPEAEQVLSERAQALGCRVDRAGAHEVYVLNQSAADSEFLVDNSTFRCPLAGSHQVANAVVAVLALRQIAANGSKPGLDDPSIAEGLEQTRWPGRLEKVASNPDVILDGAHNPAGARALAAYIQEFFAGRHIAIIYGAMRDKSVDEITEILFPLATEVIVTAPSAARALRPEAIAASFEHPRLRTTENVAAAIGLVKSLPRDAVVFITGSLYLVGEARPLFVE